MSEDFNAQLLRSVSQKIELVFFMIRARKVSVRKQPKR